MSREVEVEALGIIDAAGKLVAIFPVGLEHRYLAPHPGDRKVKFVPFDPDAARVLKAAEKALANEDENDGPGLKALWRAVERRQKRGAK